MFKNPFQVAISFAIVALVIKLTIFTLGLQHGDMENYIFFIYLFLLLLAILYGIKSNQKTSEKPTTFGDDFRTGARTASFFAIIMFAITFMYYSNIDPDFFPTKQQPYIDALLDMAKTKLQEGEPKDEVINGLSESISKVKQQLSPYAHSMLTLFGLVFIGVFNAAVLAFMMKKFPSLK